MKITLLWEPKSTQHIYKITCRWKFASMYMSKEWKAIKESYSLQARTQKTELYGAWISVEVYLYFWTKRRSDIDNFHKLWLDALSWVIYEDDKQIQEMYVKKCYDKENPRIELIFKELWEK